MIAVAGDEALEFRLGVGAVCGVEDAAQFGPDALADGAAWCVVDGVLGEMELASLPESPGQDGLAGGAETGVVSLVIETTPRRPRAINPSRQARQWTSASDGSDETPRMRRLPSGSMPKALSTATSRTTPAARCFS